MEEIKKNETIDLSKQGLKQLQRTWNENDNVESLILDENELSALENVGELPSLQQLSAARNRIRRMSSLPPLVNLTSLDLCNNSIVCIEGLKVLKALKHLNLSGNYIKIIDHLSNNVALEYLDISDNAIGHINDISYLVELKVGDSQQKGEKLHLSPNRFKAISKKALLTKELNLHKNHISHLRQCEKYLPSSLEVMTLHDNSIVDLAEVSRLEKISCLKHISIRGNPCLEAASTKPGFNYRPYLKMWCLNLTMVDDTALDPLESLKAEWLYSQGRGRRFRPGEQEALVSFLVGASPLTAKTIGADEDRKLLLILSKAEQYKQQLREQLPGDRSPTRMVSSYHDAVPRHSARASPEVMSRSLDCSVLRNSPPSSHRTTPNHTVRSATPLQAATTLVPVPESLVSPDVCRPLHPLLPQPTNRSGRSPLATAPVKNSASPHSTPGSRRRVQPRASPNASPKTTPTKIAVRKPRTNENHVPEEVHEMSARKLQSIQLRASQKRHKQGRGQPLGNAPAAGSTSEKKAKVSVANLEPEATADVEAERVGSDVWRAALCIQRRWRGFRARSRDPAITEAAKAIQASRMQDYIMKVSEDMEATKTALEGNRKLQVLQMKAIDAVWRKLNGSDVDGLAASCVNLTRQVEELRGLVQSLQANGHAAAVPTSTQTDIVAVRTPQGDAVFPIPSRRPSHLLLTDASQPADTVPASTEQEEASISEPVSVCLTPACQEGRDLQAISSPTPSLD